MLELVGFYNCQFLDEENNFSLNFMSVSKEQEQIIFWIRSGVNVSLLGFKQLTAM